MWNWILTGYCFVAALCEHAWRAVSRGRKS